MNNNNNNVNNNTVLVTTKVVAEKETSSKAQPCPHCHREFTNLRHHINQQHMHVTQSREQNQLLDHLVTYITML